MLNILLYHEPKSSLEAKFSVEYWVAAALVYGQLGLEQITDEAVNNPEVQRIIPKVKVVPNPDITVDKARVKMQIKMKDGSSHAVEYFPAKGSAENPMSQDELLAKFLACAAWQGLDRKSAEQAGELIMKMEDMENPRVLMKLLSAQS
jgi:2-methylcitrate dehydratase PrpD